MLLFGRLGLEGLLFLARLLLLSALVLNAFVVWCLLFYVLLGPGFQGLCCLGAWVLNRVVVWRCVVFFFALLVPWVLRSSVFWSFVLNVCVVCVLGL